MYYYITWNGVPQQDAQNFKSLQDCEEYINRVSVFGKSGFSIHHSESTEPIKKY